MSVEIKRKIVHIGNGSWTFLLPFIDRTLAILIVLVVVLLVAVLFRPNRPRPFEKIFYSMARETDIEKGYLKGPLLYVIMILFLVVFCDFRIAGAAFACMAFGDGFATLIGMRGKRKISGDKTLEGSISFFIVGTLMSGLIFALIEIFNTPGAGLVIVPLLIIEDKIFFESLFLPFLLILIFTVFVATFLEQFTDNIIDDNISIPFFVAMSLTVGCYML